MEIIAKFFDLQVARDASDRHSRLHGNDRGTSFICPN